VTTTTQRCSRPPWATSLTVGLTTCRDDRYTSRYKAKLFSHATLHYVAFTAGTTNQSLPTGLLLAGLPAFLWAFKATNTRTQQHAVSSRVSLGDCQTTSQCHQNLQKRKNPRCAISSEVCLCKVSHSRWLLALCMVSLALMMVD